MSVPMPVEALTQAAEMAKDVYGSWPMLNREERKLVVPLLVCDMLIQGGQIIAIKPQENVRMALERIGFQPGIKEGYLRV